jgi:hypothetical protein
MGSYERIATLKIETAQERAHAVSAEVARAQNRVYTSPGSRRVLDFVRDAAVRISGKLDSEKGIVADSLLSAAELETRRHRVTRLIPFLHVLLGFVEGSDVHRSPGQLIPTLRRYTQSVLPNSEIVISSKPELNYSIRDIAGPLKKLFEGTPVETSCALLPDQLFIVSIPAVESGQVLIHAVLAHELGHALYDKQELARTILPKIKLNEDLVRKLAKLMYERQRTQGSPTPELRLRKQITEEITQRVNGWVKELCLDAIGMRLFGPALFFAAVHLFVSFAHIDASSDTHPSPRLRIKLMSRMLKQNYAVDTWHKDLQSLMADWDAISTGEIPSAGAYDQLALETLTDSVLDLIIEASKVGTLAASNYTHSRFVADVANLVPFFLNHIPPGELGACDCGIPVDLASVINAGWYVYLCNFEKFRKNLHPNDRQTRFSATEKLHGLVLKALEISGIRNAWEEAKIDSQRGGN